MGNPLIVQPAVEDVERIFFNGMLKGWAAGKNPDHGILKDHFQYDHEEGDFKLMDMFYISKFGNHTHSSGSTLIYWRGQIAWSMHYGGHYEDNKLVLNFLQSALFKAYSERNFFGGRGPTTYESEKIAPYLAYNNTIYPDGKGFVYSRGRDHIYDRQRDKERGFHDYWCQLAF